MITPVVPAGRLLASGQPTLQVDELSLRPLLPSDAPAVALAYQDPAIQQWHCRSMTEAEAADWIAASAARWQAESDANWAVVDGDSLVGRMGLNHIDLFGGVADIAYWTVASARGRQVAARALRAVADWAFTSAGLHRLKLNHSVANPASCRVAQKAGFRHEGTALQSGLHPDGWHDMHLHARLSGDSGRPSEPAALTGIPVSPAG